MLTVSIILCFCVVLFIVSLLPLDSHSKNTSNSNNDDDEPRQVLPVYDVLDEEGKYFCTKNGSKTLWYVVTLDKNFKDSSHDRAYLEYSPVFGYEWETAYNCKNGVRYRNDTPEPYYEYDAFELDDNRKVVRKKNVSFCDREKLNKLCDILNNEKMLKKLFNTKRVFPTLILDGDDYIVAVGVKIDDCGEDYLVVAQISDEVFKNAMAEAERLTAMNVSEDIVVGQKTVDI